jgi:hypothetical protein
MSLGNLKLHGHFDILPLMETEVVPGLDQQPITNFMGLWDAFTVHGVNNPLVRRECVNIMDSLM